MEIKFNNIREEVSRKYKNEFKKVEEETKTKEGLKNICVLRLRKEYKGNFEQRRNKALKLLKKRISEEMNNTLNFISSVENSPDFNFLSLNVGWKRSQMWGKNPKVYTNKGFIGSSIGGCGYDKLSTATAEGLNSDKSLLKELFKMEEMRLKESPKTERRKYINYGLNPLSVLPSFSGGVGIESHKGIIEKLGLKWERVLNTSNMDIINISKE